MLEIVAGTYRVEVGDELRECSLRGRVKHVGSATNVAVGDRVRVECLPNGSCRIRQVLPRSSTLSRLGVARRREQVIAANVDQVAAVVAVARPEPDYSMLDRLLVLAELNRLEGLILVNKADLLGAGKADHFPPDLEPYAEIGYPMLLTSAKTGRGLAELRERVAGRTTVLSGPSGTGKSSLVNTLLPGLDLRIGEVGERKGRGRHTTVSASLHAMPGGGYVVDTPGLQYVALWEADIAELSAAFPEIAAAGADCRFADCRHRAEPDCAVRPAVEEGRVTRSRYESYLALLQEAEGGR